MEEAAETLFWHRRDLRVQDNVGLEQATEVAPVAPVYVLDPTLLRYAGDHRIAFFRRALESLQEAYRDMGSDLLVREGDPTAVIPELARAAETKRVVWNQDHSRYATERDIAVLEALEDAGVEAIEAADMTLHEPGSILTTNGDHYSVYSYYYRKWAEGPAASPAAAPTATDLADLTAPDVGEVATTWTAEEPPLAAGREPAVTRLEQFLDGPIYEYEDRRDDPAAEGTSRLSQDLKFGTLGIREVFAETEAARETAADEAAREGVTAFQRQLAWRDFYVQVLAANPATVRENFKTYANPIEWRSDEEALEAWKRGKTGYPIVDAGMRQLRTTGYMHNRVRMIVASFLTKDLLMDWRHGYRWFRERLVDHETANDVGGWQWAASTGTDAQPYFRIFNPRTQGERFDPEAEYIRTYVPELAEVEPATIHDWPELPPERRDAVAPEYPAPIVDHADRREAAIEMFERARGED